jgi:methylenetetrahydrofolate dehydrogenase (NADP+) / methenyltetrahydrofolate cyclohydrolase / formyltetrahydrofolate synthetase
LRSGMSNLEAHIVNARKFGIPVVVAVNRFVTDDPAEIELVKEFAINAGAFAAVEADPWAGGGPGCVELAEAVVAACEEPSNFQFLYELNQPIAAKIDKIATELYGASGIELTPQAQAQINGYEKNGFGYLPICMAKTHLSMSHDPTLKGAPKGFVLPVREVRASVGAGFIYPITGTMRTMPGLGTRPAYMNVDIGEDGEVVGLF